MPTQQPPTQLMYVTGMVYTRAGEKSQQSNLVIVAVSPFY